MKRSQRHAFRRDERDRRRKQVLHPAVEEVDLHATGDSPWWRNRDGDVVHRSSCPRKGRASPWPYAAGWREDRLRRLVRDLAWLRLCKVCLPDREEQ